MEVRYAATKVPTEKSEIILELFGSSSWVPPLPLRILAVGESASGPWDNFPGSRVPI